MEKEILNICINLMVEAGELTHVEALFVRGMIKHEATGNLKDIPDNIEDIFTLSIKKPDSKVLRKADKIWRDAVFMTPEGYLKETILELL